MGEIKCLREVDDGESRIKRLERIMRRRKRIEKMYPAPTRIKRSEVFASILFRIWRLWVERGRSGLVRSNIKILLVSLKHLINPNIQTKYPYKD